MRTLVVLLLTATLAFSQAAQTPTAILPSNPSQTNSNAAGLVMSAVVQSPGEIPSPTVTPLGPSSPSTTLAYQSFGSTTFPSPGVMNLNGAVLGGAQSPFVLALSVSLTSQFCGGFAGWPCMTGPTLFSSIPTSFGTYHLDANPIILFDGLSNAAVNLGPTGSFPLAGNVTVDTVTNGGVEQSFALQGVVFDPAAPAAFRLTACLNVDQWVFYL